MPRPPHARQQPAAVETFRATFGAQLHAKNIPLETRVHLWVIDGMRFGLQPVPRRVWTLRGEEIVGPVAPRHQWGDTYGALEVWGAGAEFLPTDGVSRRRRPPSTSHSARADLATLQEAINTVLRECWAKPKLVRSLIGEGLVSREANPSSRSVLAV